METTDENFFTAVDDFQSENKQLVGRCLQHLQSVGCGKLMIDVKS